MNSNIIANSNVCLSKTEDPRHDQEFVCNVFESDRLKSIAHWRYFDNRVAEFNDIQHALLGNHKRCVYNKTDSCIGYDSTKRRTVNKCLNGKCKYIMECNPNYSREEELLWTTSEEERKMYGDPSKLRRYYVVDLISDEEMIRYECNPFNEGLEYPTEKEKIQEEPKNVTEIIKSKIDPLTGKRMIVIGHEWRIVDNASYEGEKLFDIWGYAEEEIVTKKTVIRKAKKIEKRITKKDVDKDTHNNLRVQSDNHQYEEKVKKLISKEIKFIDIDSDNYFTNSCLLLCANNAEVGFVASSIINAGVEMNFGRCRIASIEEKLTYDHFDTFYMTSTVIKNGCNDKNYEQWVAMSSVPYIVQINISKRRYKLIDFNNGTKRWSCQNMYGATHICIEADDFYCNTELTDGIYKIAFEKKDEIYLVSTEDGDVIGRVVDSFVEGLKVMKKNGEIDTLPQSIEGFQIEVNELGIKINGIGHMVFYEY